MPNFKSLQSLLGVPSSFEDEEELYSKMPSKEEELEAYTSTPKWSAEQYKQSITPEHREELERQQKARERTEEFEKPLEEDVGPLGALGYHVLKNIAFDERPASEFEEGGGGVYESTSPIDFITPAGVGATAKGISKAFARPGIRKVVVSEVLPAKRFEKIKQAIPSSTIEGKVVTPQLAAEERLALPAPVTEEPLGLPMPKQELPAPSTKSIEAMPIAESPAALERAVEAETPAIISSKPIARAKKSAVSQEPEPDRFVIPGMFSKTEQLIRQKMGTSASPSQIMGVLREAKPEELEYLGIPEFLEGQSKVTKEALLEHIKQNSGKIVQVPTKTLEFQLEQEKLLEREALLREEADILFTEVDMSRDYLINQLKKSGYNINEALDIIDNLEGGSKEALQTFKNISPNLADAAESYLDNNSLLSATTDNLRDVERSLRNMRSKDYSAIAQYYELESEPNLTLHHPQSRETYKEKLYQFKPDTKYTTHIRRFNHEVPVTAEGKKIAKKYEVASDQLYEQSMKVTSNFRNNVPSTPEMEIEFKKQEALKKIMDDIENGADLDYLAKNYPEIVYPIYEKLKRLDQFGVQSVGYFKDMYSDSVDQNYRLKEELQDKIFDQINQLDREKEEALSGHLLTEYRQHWNEPNVFAHSRSTEIIGPKGERGYFAQEAQSDPHQHERDLNKKLKRLEEELEKKEKEFKSFPEQINREEIKDIKNAIHEFKKAIARHPRIPFKKSWPEFLMKRWLIDATEGNFDNIHWTTGDQQNERYNLQKHIDSVRYDRENNNLICYDHDGDIVIEESVKPYNLSDYIGDELSKKLLNAEPDEDGFQNLQGVDLKTGGEGMRGFYDETLPLIASKLLKKFNVKPEKTELPNVGEVWTIKLTPEMKEYIKKYGFPMFMLPGFMQQEEVPEEKKEFKNINKLVKDKK